MATLSGGPIAPAVGREERIDAPHASVEPPPTGSGASGFATGHQRNVTHEYALMGDRFIIATAPMPRLERTPSAAGGVKGISRARKLDLAESGDDHAGGNLQPSAREKITLYEGGATRKDPYCWGI